MGETNEQEIRDAVQKRYAAAARQVKVQRRASCCSDSGCCDSHTPQLYDLSQLAEVPDNAALASLGCGNPTLLAELKPGETVLDLGSGGGIDVLLSARRVGPSGMAYGLDMTDEMLELARENATRAGVANVQFLKGEMESIPLPDASVDVIISNCVINLSADKDRVLSEAFRVLKPGGRFAVADMVVQGGSLPDSVRKVMSLWAGCIAGALSEEEYRQKLAGAGFEGVDLQVLKVYTKDDVPEEYHEELSKAQGADPDTRVISAFVKARKALEGERKTRIAIGKAGSDNELRGHLPGTRAAGLQGSVGGPTVPPAKGCCGDQVKSYFRRVATQWDQLRQGYFTEEVRESAMARAGLTPESVVADVGAGTGFMLAGLAPRVRQAYGFDNSPEMLDVARANLSELPNVELKLSEGASLPVAAGSFDAVFANMYLHHAPDPAAAIAELARVLKPSGRLVITDMDKHDHEWLREEMADLWMGFERSEVEGWYRAAGLSDIRVECTERSCCAASASREASISVFVACGIVGA